MRILLTGATGFLGSHLLHSFLSAGHTVSILKRSTSDVHRIRDVLSGCASHDIDVTPIRTIFSGSNIDTIVHTACNYGRKGEDLESIVDTNVLFPLRLMEAGKGFGVSTFINTGSLLPRAVNPYALSKAQLDEWLGMGMCGMDIVNLRIEHMYGEDDDPNKFLNWILGQLECNVPAIPLTGGIQRRDFIHVEDVVSAYLEIIGHLDSLPGYTEFAIGTGVLHSIREAVQLLRSLYVERYPDCMTRLDFGAIPYREHEPMEMIVDMTRIESMGWAPKIQLKDGLEKLIGTVGGAK